MHARSRYWSSRAAIPLAGALLALTGAGCREQERAAAPATSSAPQAVNASAPNAPPPAAPSGGESVTPKTAIPEEARVLSDAFANVAAAIRPSVVRVDVEVEARQAMAAGRGNPALPDFLREFFERGGPGPVPGPGPARGTGSGVVLDTAGHVLTNAHVVERGGKVTISFEAGKKLPGRVIGRDPMTDVAVVKVDRPPENLTVARFGNAGQLRIGEWVLAVGSPLGLQQTVTAGIVSALGKTGSGFQFASGQRVRGYVQTDAMINPGNSGGPLVNLAGEVVGINTLINVGPGGSYGFAIPIEEVRTVAQTLIKDGRMRYPYLGVMVGNAADVPPELRAQLGNDAPNEGAVVSNVTPGSPAAGAGLQPGDVITNIAGQAIKSADDLVSVVSAQKIGARVKITFVRQGKSQTGEATVGEMPTPGAPGDDEAKVGVRLQSVTPSLARALGVPADTRGAVIAEVLPASAAEKAGLAPGDVIVEVDRKPVTSGEEAARLLRAARETTLLRVVSSRGSRFVTLDLSVG